MNEALNLEKLGRWVREWAQRVDPWASKLSLGQKWFHRNLKWDVMHVLPFWKCKSGDFAREVCTKSAIAVGSWIFATCPFWRMYQRICSICNSRDTFATRKNRALPRFSELTKEKKRPSRKMLELVKFEECPRRNCNFEDCAFIRCEQNRRAPAARAIVYRTMCKLGTKK